LICYAQAGAELARYVNASGARTWDDLPVICAAERLFAPDRAELERAFGARVFETYGCREVMLIAAECPAHAGLHVSMENLIVELLVAEHGGYRAARPGEIGQIAITDLHNFGMPFIRYLNGDLAVAAPPGRCACGRGLDRLISIEGRQNDTLVAADGRSIDSLFFNVLFAAQGGKVKRFQAAQRKDGTVVLRVVPAAEFDDDVRKRLVDASIHVLGDVPFELALVDEIPVGESGKRRVVVVER
jgi:phenylacetate-CoA ligase